jgi:prepilin-type N-terminal cleavage/methylation domain-containing protein
MKRLNQKNRGFTIIELMIATLVFSIVLLVCLAAFLQVGRLFYKGVNLSLTQDNTRDIMSSISNDIRFTKNSPTTNNMSSPNGYFCIGLHRYKYMKGNHLYLASENLSSNYGLVREDISAGCPSPAVPGSGSNPTEMLGNSMQLNDLSITCVNTQCNIKVHVVFYGDDNTVFESPSHPGYTPSQALTAPDANCTGALSGSQYCATADFASTVLQIF